MPTKGLSSSEFSGGINLEDGATDGSIHVRAGLSSGGISEGKYRRRMPSGVPSSGVSVTACVDGLGEGSSEGFSRIKPLKVPSDEMSFLSLPSGRGGNSPKVRFGEEG